MYAMNFIDFIFESEPQRNFFIESLLSLFVIFHQNILIIS